MRTPLKLHQAIIALIMLLTFDLAAMAQIGSGTPFPPASAMSDQKTGSVLVYNLYTSLATLPGVQNTDISVTNTHPTLPVVVHLFFVNGVNGVAADTFISLSPKQTMSFLASDLDPGVTGYLVAVAVNSTTGCPIGFNYLIGDASCKFGIEGGVRHTANFGAQAFSALYSGDLPSWDGASKTATLVFDGLTGYNQAPRTLMVNSIGPVSEGNTMLLVVNRLGGSLAPGTSASSIGPSFGLLTDDVENSYGFNFTGNATQFLSFLSGSFPRTTPRFDILIASGRSGWMKFWPANEAAILGLTINQNSSPIGFQGGHNLHASTLATSASLTIPVSPPATSVDLTIGLTHQGNFNIGTPGSYTIAVANVGAKDATGAITVFDTLPANLTLQSFSGAGWSCTGVNTVVCANTSGLAANASLPLLNLTVNVGAGTPGSVTNTVIVSHAGDKNDVNDRSSDTTIVTNKPVTTTTLAASVNPSTSGQPVTFTATVSSGGGTPTGTVEFFDGNVSLGTGSLSGGTATLTTSALTVGVHSLRAFYSGNDTFAYSNSSSISQTVMLASKFATVTALASSLNPSKLGEQVNFTANVTSSGGTPSGDVQFFNGATSLGVRSLSNGSATLSTSALLVGTLPITAQFLGDPSFNVSVSPALSQVVTQTDPGIPYAPDTVFSDQKRGSVLVYNLYTSNAATPALQNTVINIANTHPTSPITVQFYFVNGANGRSSERSIFLAPNQIYSLLASEVAPDQTGYVVAVAMDIIPRALSAQSGCPRSFNYLIGDAYIKLATGQRASLGAEAFAAIANPPTACGPTGAIALNFDGVSYDMAPRVLSVNSITGSGSLLVINRLGGNLAAGGSAATIGSVLGTLFDDTENGFNFSFSGGVQIVDTLSNSFPITSPPLNIIIPTGRSGWMKFSATDDVPLLGATIGFVTGNLDALTLNKSGVILLRESLADLSISKTAGGDFRACSTGNYTITVANAVNASAATGVITVTDTLPGNLTLASFSGSGWTCAGIGAANVSCSNSSGLAPGASLPNLTLTVNVGPGTPTGANSITNTAVVSLASQQESNLSNNSSSVQTNVNKLATTSAIVASANPSVCGQTVTFTAQVGSAVACSSPPTGIVTFSDGEMTLGVGMLNAAGQAAFSISSLAVASHQITASYSGDINYGPSASPALAQTVSKAMSAITVASSSSTVFFGQPVTFTAQVNLVAPASGTPTGTVQFMDNGVSIGSPVTLSGGSASLATSALTVGAHNITASYSGDSCFAAATTSTALAVTVLAVPDLQVTAINAPSLIYSDNAFDLTWTDQNNGLAPAAGPWTDRVYLSTDGQPGNDTLIAGFPFAQSLDPGQSVARAQLITIPRSAVPADGPYFLIVVTDADNNVNEGVFENNNFRAIPITVQRPPLPDLIVQSIEAPATAFFDQTITVRWTVKNNGAGSTNASQWSDRLFLSNDRTPGGEDAWQVNVLNVSYLNAGDSYIASADVRIPRGLFGDYYVIVTADVNNAVVEENNGNNTLDKAINIQIPTLPDLQVSLVQAPEEGFAGQPALINWRVENHGTGNTLPAEAVWFDGVYLSKDPSFNPATARFIGSRKHEGGLQKDGGYLVSGFSVNLPTDIVGDWFVFVITDYLNGVYEFTGENNNSNYDQRRPLRIRATPPDLIVSAVTAPAVGVAGKQVSVSWTVRNQGAFDAGPNWFDTVYFSNTAALNPATATSLATVYRGGNLGPGSTYTASANVTLPPCLNGTSYLFVYTDSRKQVFEYDPNFDAEGNNVTQPQAIQITSDPPDLQVTAIANPPTGTAGQAISINWTVTNRGTGLTTAQTWLDRVYFSSTATFNAGSALLAGAFTHTGGLAPNASYSSAENVVIPVTAQGNYYIFIWTDALDAVEECSGDDNNITPSVATINVSNNLPDLKITAVNAPSMVTSGQTINISWSGQNAGATSVRNSAWADAVYLSNDQTFDGSDRRLAATIISGPLPAGGVYSGQAVITIPILSPGAYYIIVKSDYQNFVFEGVREDNNTASIPVQVQTPDVDLRVTAVNAPSESFSGQEMAVSWAVNNNGSARTAVSQWSDHVILSRDQILDSTDRSIGYLLHNGALDGGAGYQANLNVIVPAGLSGPYYVFVVTDVNGLVAESDKNNNARIASNPIILQIPPPADLTVTAINIPAAGSPGENAVVQWTTQNAGVNAATGSWLDAVYLSKDRTWDNTDALIGRVDHSGPLTPGGSYAGMLNAVLPSVEPGQYYVIVRTDVRNNVREENETNNNTASIDSMTVDVTELTLGVPHNSTIRTAQERYYKVNAPGNETLRFLLDGQNPQTSNELFTRFGSMPSRSAFDFLFNKPNEPDQEIVVPNTLAGIYYSLVRGAYVPSSSSPDPFSIKAELIPFSITSVSPNRIGDNGQVTITLKGARFKDGATVKLVKDGVTLTAAKVMVIDSATVKARFLLNHVPQGTYDVELTNPGAATATAPQAITIEQATQLIVGVGAIGDTRPRLGRKMLTDSLLENKGNIDIPYVTVLVSFDAEVNVAIRRPEKTLPRHADYPDFDWESNDLTATKANGVTRSQFIVRDLEVGQQLPFTVTTTGFGASLFGALIKAIPLDTPQYLLILRTTTESFRQQLINYPNLPASPELARLYDENQFWQWMLEGFIQYGYVDLGSTTSTYRDVLTLAPASLLAGDGVCPADNTCLYGIGGAALACAIGSLPISGGAAFLPCFIAWGGAGVIICIIDQIRNSNDPDCLFYPPDKACTDRGGTWDPCANIDPSIGCLGGCIQPQRPSDPNDKIGPVGFGPQAFIGNQRPLSYTINFENVATASAAAQRIRLSDQLDPNLDPRTFRLREIGFGKYRVAVPENRAFFQSRVQLGEELGNIFADISAGVDISTGQVTWTLTAIDPATGEQPVSASLGLLPPNDDTGRGQGFVTYTILPKAGAPTGTVISNNATITFDTEEPITTNTVTNTLDADPPTSAVNQLPTSSQETFTISWSGNDVAGGSELQNFEIWFSEDNGPYQPFLTATTETSAQFTGIGGKTYRFYSIARDNSGNVEAAPATPDAMTLVVQAQNPVPTLANLNPASAIIGGPQFTLTVNGTNFISGSTVNWNGSPRATTYSSSTQLTATIPATDLAMAGTAAVTVVNPAPGGGASNAIGFIVIPPLSADITLGKTALPGLVEAGANVTYTLRVTNQGPGTAASVMVTDNLPVEMIFVSCSSTGGGVCSGTDNNRLITFASLDSGSSATISLTAKVNPSATAGVVISNTATVSSATTDPNPFNNEATATTYVLVPDCVPPNCEEIGPGIPLPASSASSDQKPGSVLIYNLYSSNAASPNIENTRINLTNTDPGRMAFVHLFFVDGSYGSVADMTLCMTPNQTVSFLASDLDPGTTGYLVVVAVDRFTGCPIQFNALIGDAYLKLASGHAANLTAEAFAALSATPGGACDGAAMSATLAFDGVNYSAAPRVAMLDNVLSASDGNSTFLVLNGVGGDLRANTDAIGALTGLLFDDEENGYSFNVTGGCQLKGILTQNFPRTNPRFTQVVPSGRSGWMKFWTINDSGLVGAAINFNPNVAASASAYNQGHNLHKLTLTTTAKLTIPVFPPSCR